MLYLREQTRSLGSDLSHRRSSLEARSVGKDLRHRLVYHSYDLPAARYHGLLAERTFA